MRAYDVPSAMTNGEGVAARHLRGSRQHFTCKGSPFNRSSHKILITADRQTTASCTECLFSPLKWRARLPLRHLPHGVRFRWSVWRAARHYRKNPPGAYVTGVSNPVSATGSRDFMFSTNREDRRVIPTDIRPAALRMRVPVADTILASSLPYRVRRYGKTVFEVREFLPTGFVISDQSPGLMVQGEIFYSELVPVRDLPAQSPPAPPTPPDSPSGSLTGRRALRVALTRTGD